MDTTSLHNMAQKLRLEAVRMVYEGKDGHPGPALSIADIVADLGRIGTASSSPRDMRAPSTTRL